MKRQIKIFLTAIITGALFVSCTALAADIEAPPKQNMAGSPDATREKFCDLAYNVLKIRMGTELTTNTGMFTDTDKAEINTLAEAGIIDGRGNGIFDPQGKITREEAARILCSMMDYMGIEDMNVVDETFKDFDTVSDWAKEYVAKVGRNEIMEGNGDGYDFNEKEGYTNTPRDSFHLYNSDFGPHQNYTVWQTQATLYRLSNRLPEKTEDETVTDLGGGVTLADNPKYTYAEKDGHVTFCMPHGEKYFLAERNEGQPILAHDESVYDLATGSRIKKFRHKITELTNVYASTKAYLDMRFTGMPNIEYNYSYDFDGNMLSTYSYSDEIPGGKIKQLTDPDGGAHYMFRNDDGNYLTEVYSVKPIVSGKLSISENIEGSNCFVCTVGDKDNPTYQVYDFDGTLLYEGEKEALALGRNNYMIRKDGGGFEVYSSETNEKKFDAAGDELKDLTYNYTNLPAYFVTYTKKETVFSDRYNIYSYDGSVLEENLRLYADETTYYGEEYLLAYNDGYINIYTAKDMTLYKRVEGGGHFGYKPYSDILENAQYFYNWNTDGELIICDTRFNPIINVGKRNVDEIFDYNILLVYPDERHNDDGQGRYTIYDLKDLSFKAELGEGTLSGSNSLKSFALVDCGDEYRLYSYADTSNYVAIEKLTYKTFGGEEPYKIRISEENGIAAIEYSEKRSWYSDMIDLYDSSLNKIYSCDYAVSWSDRHVAKNFRNKAGSAVYNYDGSETGIECGENHIQIAVVNGKERFITSEKYGDDYYSVIYDGDTLQEVSRTPYQFRHAADTYFVFDNHYGGESHFVYTDENGNEIPKPEEE